MGILKDWLDKLMNLFRYMYTKLKKVIPLITITGIFLISLSTSMLAKTFLDLNSDFFTSFSTLTAAYLAYYLYSDWRDEKDYDNKVYYAKKILQSIQDIFLIRTKILKNIDIILNIKRELIINTNLLHSSELKLMSITKSLFVDMQTLSVLISDDELNKIHYNINLLAELIDTSYEQIIEKYRDYYFHTLKQSNQPLLGEYNYTKHYTNKTDKHIIKLSDDLSKLIDNLFDIEIFQTEKLNNKIIVNNYSDRTVEESSKFMEISKLIEKTQDLKIKNKRTIHITTIVHDKESLPAGGIRDIIETKTNKTNISNFKNPIFLFFSSKGIKGDLSDLFKITKELSTKMQKIIKDK